ncbi:MAG: phage integrase N-terminal SAM-like domain-containing protein, partial [Chitinophagales bacterium]
MTEFKKYLQSKNINPTSIQKYIVQVEKFKTYLAKDLDSVEKKDILNYLQFLQENKNLSNRTRQQTL